MVRHSGENFDENSWSAAASPGERKVCHTPVLQQHRFLFLTDMLIPKDDPFLLRKLLGAVIMVVGYSLGRAFIYSTPEYAVMKLPYQILQAVVGAVVGMILFWKFGIRKLYLKAL